MKRLFLALAIIFSLSVFTSCREQKTTEDKIEEAADEAGDALEDAADEVEDVVDDN